jgi:hypothetical protein
MWVSKWCCVVSSCKFGVVGGEEKILWAEVQMHKKRLPTIYQEKKMYPFPSHPIPSVSSANLQLGNRCYGQSNADSQSRVAYVEIPYP